MTTDYQNPVTITTSIKVLKALLLFAGKDDIRGYLNAVSCECGPGGTRLLATNGHIAALAKVDGQYPIARFRIPRVAVETIRVPSRMPHVSIIFSPTGSDAPGGVTLRGANASVSALCIKCWDNAEYRLFPPATLSGESAHFNLEYLNRLCKAGRILCGPKSDSPAVFQNGDRPALSIIRDDFIALIMPRRLERDQASTPPQWAFDPVFDAAGEVHAAESRLGSESEQLPAATGGQVSSHDAIASNVSADFHRQLA